MNSLNFELHYGGDLAETNVLDLLQAVLERYPAFSARLRVLEYEGDRQERAVDVGQFGALKQAVVEKGSHRGPAFEQLSKAAPPAFPRRFGEVLLRGRARSNFIKVRFDAHTPAMRMGDQWLFSNGFSGWVGAAQVDRRPRDEWVADIAFVLADHPDFLWGAAYEHDEFRMRNLDETNGARALGRDMSRALPGLYWLNLFGEPYAELIGAEVLRSAPAHQVTEGEHAVVLQVFESPTGWLDEAGRDQHAAVSAHLGREYFFDRTAPERVTRAPDFGLEPLDPLPPFQVVAADGQHFTPIPPSETG